MAARGTGWDAPTAVVRLALQLDHIEIEHPLAVVFEGDPPKEVGRSPLLKYTIDLKLFFERIQLIRIVIYTLHHGGGIGDGGDQLERVGSVSASLGRLVSLGTCFMNFADERANQRKRGLLKVSVSYVSSPRTSRRISIKLAASQLDRMDLGGVGRSDPYYVISREDTGEVLYKSEYIPNTLECVWSGASVDLREYDADGKFEPDGLPIRFDVWDEDLWADANEIIGTASTTLGKLQDGTVLDLVTTRHSGLSGHLTVISVSIEDTPSFGEYLVNGLDLSTGVVIDFTASNMRAEDERSLHYLDSENVYMQVVDAVLQPILQFDLDGEVASLGFGAQPSPDLPTEFDFTLRRGDTIQCQGVEGVKEAYQDAVTRLTLSGPAKLVPALDKFLDTLRSGKAAKSRLRYLVVLVIADGVPMELDEVVKKVVELSTLPISVLFVGVGPADFDRLKEVCAVRPIRDKGDTSRRESHRTLHFAQLNKCKQIILDELYPEQIAKRQAGGFPTVDELSLEVLKELRYMIHDFLVSASVRPVRTG